MAEGIGSICGGVISQSMQTKDMKKYGVWVNAMSYVLPDKQYKKYIAFMKAKKNKEAEKVFDKFAISQI